MRRGNPVVAESGVTKKVLAYALKNLMETRPLNKITVGDICEACDMNRKSFYYHFQDKYDLVNWIFYTEFFDEFQVERTSSADALVRIDMTEYMEQNSVSRLIGAPPGYVGYDEGGQLTEAVRRHPYSVVLFDEVEKAHPDVFNILLQVLDDGRLTDGQGRVVSFKNAIIILTSNLGSQYLLEGIKPDGSISEDAQAAVMHELKGAFRPEFLNRLDEIIMFKPLTRDNLRGIIDIMVEGLRARLADKSLKLDITDAAKALIIERGYDPLYGARPLRRYLQSSVETLIARRILSGDIAAGATLTVDVENGELICR